VRIIGGITMKEDVEKALTLIRPALARDGGDIQLVSVEDGVVKVQLKGACGGCPMSKITMSQGVERVIRQHVPGIKEVIAV
jgi:Fe-S cluster biogenesis protein NfuA